MKRYMTQFLHIYVVSVDPIHTKLVLDHTKLYLSSLDFNISKFFDNANATLIKR